MEKVWSLHFIIAQLFVCCLWFTWMVARNLVDGAYDGAQINYDIIGQIFGVALMVKGWHLPPRLRECKGAQKKKNPCRLFEYIIIKYYYNKNNYLILYKIIIYTILKLLLLLLLLYYFINYKIYKWYNFFFLPVEPVDMVITNCMHGPLTSWVSLAWYTSSLREDSEISYKQEVTFYKGRKLSALIGYFSNSFKRRLAHLLIYFHLCILFIIYW